jgi:hypothetical protein
MEVDPLASRHRHLDQARRLCRRQPDSGIDGLDVVPFKHRVGQPFAKPWRRVVASLARTENAAGPGEQAFDRRNSVARTCHQSMTRRRFIAVLPLPRCARLPHAQHWLERRCSIGKA